MASPQKENGYTAIANKIMEALASIRIPGEARQMLDVILRKTYGWNKKEDEISLSQFRKITGLTSPHLIRVRNKLLKMNIIAVAQKGNSGILTYRFQKDYTKWKSLPKKVTLPKKAISVAQKGNLALPKKVDTKDTITKPSITKQEGIDFTKDMLQLFEQEFKRYWDDYDPRGQKNKQYAKKRFIALCKIGELPEFDKGYTGYSNYLKNKRINEGFDQRPKYFSTLISDYEEYIGFEYKPPK